TPPPRSLRGKRWPTYVPKRPSRDRAPTSQVYRLIVRRCKQILRRQAGLIALGCPESRCWKPVAGQPSEWPYPTAYSDRNAWLGESDDARSAGINDPRSAEIPSASTAIVITAGL